MLEKFLENLLIRLRSSQATYSERLLAGSFKTLEDYRNIAGHYNGLLESELIAKKLYKDMVDMSPIENPRMRLYGNSNENSE